MRVDAWALALLVSVALGCDGQTEDGLDVAPTLDAVAAQDVAAPDAEADAASASDLAPLDGEPPDAAVDGSAPDGGLDGGLDGGPDATLDAALDAAADMAPDAAAMAAADVVAYCDCMLLTCHDLYHRLWGEDEGVARARCFRVATDLPRAPEATEGDSLECRAHWCAVSFDLDDPELCERAGGVEVCR